MNRNLQAIQDRVGFVPVFLQTMESLPDTIGPEFELMRRYWFATSSIEPRARALVGIAVATSLGYRNLASFHCQAVPGLTDGDINGAEFIAASTVGWSAYLVGRSVSIEGFRRDVDRMRQGLEKFVKEGGTWSPESTTQDQIRAVYGFVPEFLAELSRLPGALDGAWANLKTLHLHQAELSSLEKALVGLASASVTHCPYAVAFYSMAARLAGASEIALQECALLARQNAQWGAYLHVRGLGAEALRADCQKLQAALSRVAAP